MRSAEEWAYNLAVVEARTDRMVRFPVPPVPTFMVRESDVADWLASRLGGR